MFWAEQQGLGNLYEGVRRYEETQGPRYGNPHRCWRASRKQAASHRPSCAATAPTSKQSPTS